MHTLRVSVESCASIRIDSTFELAAGLLVAGTERIVDPGRYSQTYEVGRLFNADLVAISLVLAILECQNDIDTIQIEHHLSKESARHIVEHLMFLLIMNKPEGVYISICEFDSKKPVEDEYAECAK